MNFLRVATWLGAFFTVTTLLRAAKPSPGEGYDVRWRSLDGNLYESPGAIGLGWWMRVPAGTPFYTGDAGW